MYIAAELSLKMLNVQKCDIHNRRQ